MELSEVSDLIFMNMTIYKNSAKPLSETELELTASIWYWHFKDYDAKDVKLAFLAANSVCVYPVQPADIFKQLEKMNRKNIPSNTELWETLKKSISKIPALMYRKKYPLVTGFDKETGNLIQSDGTKEIKEIYENLPEQIKRFFSSVDGMMSFSLLSENEIERYKKREFFDFLEKNESFLNCSKELNKIPDKKTLRLVE